MFRETLSSFFRIYGKENTDERRPLYGKPGDNLKMPVRHRIYNLTNTTAIALTPDDTGTGSNYRGMVSYDLAVLKLTALAHDSLILKNISDGAVDDIMKIYEQSEKQIFIAFDK